MTNEELATQESEKIKADADQISEYKAKYKVIKKVVSVDDAGNEHVLWLKSPSRLAVGIFMAAAKQNVIEANEYIFNDAAIQEISDMEYFQQDSVFYGLNYELQSIISVKKSTSMTL